MKKYCLLLLQIPAWIMQYFVNMKSLRFMYILATSGVSQTFNESCIFLSVRRLSFSLYTRATLCQHSKPSSCLCSNPILDDTHTHTRTFWNNCFTLAVLLKYSKHVLRNNFRRNTFIWMHRGSQWCWAASLRCGAGVKPLSELSSLFF